jgi:hypothetical protein
MKERKMSNLLNLWYVVVVVISLVVIGVVTILALGASAQDWPPEGE